MIDDLRASVALCILNIPLWAKGKLIRISGFRPSKLFEPWDKEFNEFLKWRGLFDWQNLGEEVDRAVSRSEKSRINIITASMDEYPDILRSIVDFPPVLFCKGDSSILKQKSISVVGTRTMTPYGRAVVTKFIPPLCMSGLCIVSGMAKGVDAQSHLSTLNSRGKTIAVLGSGVDEPYPVCNNGLYERIIKEGGLVVSEFVPGTPGFKQNFPMRNRIIAGLSDSTIVVEAGIKSGSLITASMAMSYHRDVFSVPGPVNSSMSEGTNSLIKRGALMACSSDDILDHYGLLFGNSNTNMSREQISDSARALLGMLDVQGSSASDLLSLSGFSSGELFKNLEELEHSSYIFRDGFGIYHLN